MTRQPTADDRSTSVYALVLWIYTGVIMIAMFYAFGNIFEDPDSGSEFNLPAAIGGAAAAALSTIPFWALYSLGAHVLANITKLRTDLAHQES